MIGNAFSAHLRAHCPEIVPSIKLQLIHLTETFTLRLKMSNPNRSMKAATKTHNRIGAIMSHITRYSFRGTSRLAQDSGVSKSTISQLRRGLSNPLYTTVCRVVKSLERQLERKLDEAEVISHDGSYPTSSVCELCGCPGCLPDSVYYDDGARTPQSRGVVPGLWTGDVFEFDDARKGSSRRRGNEN